jgi:hypothetical protein
VESVPAASTVRRTVRVAVALIVGQALLVALIGWLTFGRAGDSDSAVDQLAAPPQAPPPTATSRYATPSRSATTSPEPPRTSVPATTERRAVPTRTPPATTLATSDPAPPSPLVETPSPSATVTSSAPPDLSLIPPAPPAASDVPVVQAPVTVGAHCWPEGAYGWTAGGTLVRCVRTPHHRPRWKIV